MCSSDLSGETGSALVKHPDVAKISLTGSVATGKRVAALAAESLKKVTLELGGKSPIVVFDDCDTESAINAALAGNFYSRSGLLKRYSGIRSSRYL